MPISKVIILALLLIVNCKAFSQVEHNFKMDPEKTNCHEIKLTGKIDSDLSIIHASTFRLTEVINISKYHSPNKAEFYSCDGIIGYMVATENDSTIKIYTDIKKNVWDSLSNSDDPIMYYKLKFLNEKN